MGMGIQISEFLLLVLWGVYPAVGFPVHPVILCFIFFFLSNIILFSVVPIPFYTAAVYKGSILCISGLLFSLPVSSFRFSSL